MNKKISLLGALLLLSSFVFAQIESEAVAQGRFKYDKSIYVGGGGSFPFGKNIGDYSVGGNFQFGFLKRLNKVLSIGGGIEFTAYLYDPEKSYNFIDSDGTGYNFFFNDAVDAAYSVTITGGDLSLVSLSFDTKFYLIPVGDNTKITVYGFARPFLTFATKSEVKLSYEYYEDNGGWEFIDDGEWLASDYPALAEETTVSGGIFLGPGIEFLPSKRVSIYAQASFGYTFPIPFVSSGSFEQNYDGLGDDNFPIVSKGFPSLNIQLGICFNF
jgi:hypothetical protein